MDQSRRSWMSYALFFGIVLSPALLQPVTCNRGNPNLASLEFESEGQNQIVAFSPAQTVYDVSVGSSPAILRAYSQDATATVSYRFWDNSVFIDTVPLGPGGGVANITVPQGQSTFQVSVATREGGSQFYSMNVVHAAAGFPCTEQGIRDAIAAGGGPHTFDCEGQPPVLTSSTIDINNDVILDGGGNLTVDGQTTHRVFSVPAGTTAELRGMTITHGGGALGNGIYNDGALTVANSTVSDNQRGGIINDDTLTVTDSLITGNTNAVSGGGVTNRGTLTMTDSTVSDNTSSWNGGIGLLSPAAAADITRSVITRNQATANTSGGIGVGAGCVLTVTDSTVSDNSSADSGAGIASGADAIVTVVRSTVSGNSTPVSSGGVGIGAGGTLFVVNSTISGNSADVSGGGLAVDTNGTAEVRHSTIVDNTSALGGAIGTLGTVSLWNSIIVGDCAVLGPPLWALTTLESPGLTCGLDVNNYNEMGVAPSVLKLGPLQDNGGPTLTHAPYADDSRALDFIAAWSCADHTGAQLTVDQRGEPRPQNMHCDGGAVEGYCESCDDDGNDCTAGACDPVTRACSDAPAPDGEPCDSGNGECVAGVCDHCVGVTCPDDGNECTDDACEPSTGLCPYPPVPDGTSCDSGNGECIAGVCDLCAGAICPPDGNECTDDCDSLTGACLYTPLPNGALCDLDNFECQGGVCGREQWTGVILDTRTNSLQTFYSPILDLAMDSVGNSIAAWRSVTLKGPWANRYRVDLDRWELPDRLDDDSYVLVLDAGMPSVAMSSDGNAIAVWSQQRHFPDDDPTAWDVWVRRYDAAAGWLPPEIIIFDIGRARASAEAAIGPNGDAIFVMQSQYSAGEIWAYRYTNAEGWVGPAVLALSSEAPHVAMDSNGKAMVVWQQWNEQEQRNEIFSRRQIGGQIWALSEPVHPNHPADAERPQVALDDAGNATAVWYQLDGNDTFIHANRYTVGQGWGTPSRIDVSSASDKHVFGLQVATSASGDALAVWRRETSDNDYHVYANHHVGTWSGVRRLDTHASSAGNPSVAMNPNGDALVVWNQGDPVDNISSIWSTHFDVTWGWREPGLIETTFYEGVSPKVAMDANGGGMAVWAQLEYYPKLVSSRFEFALGSRVFECSREGLLAAVAQGRGPLTFDCTVPTTVTLSEELRIKRDLILDGEGLLTIEGSGGPAGPSARVVRVDSGVTATLRNLAITGGNFPGFASGIVNTGTLALESVTVFGNQGGGIWNSPSGILSMADSTVADNVGSAVPGVQNDGTMTVLNTTISGNEWGGIWNQGDAEVRNSTISGNTASRGAGIYNYAGELVLVNATISNNTANITDGGSIYNRADAELLVTNSVIDGDCAGAPVSSGGHNVESPGATCSLGGLGELQGVSLAELNLGPLANNGGPTLTHAPQTGSVAIDHIPLANCYQATDQRGLTRPQATLCDVGAVEVTHTAPTLSNIRSELVLLNQCGIPNTSSFGYIVDYTDPNGDVTDAGTRVFIETVRSDGFANSYESDSAFNNVTGNGFTGTVRADNCLKFEGSTWVDVTMTIWDAFGQPSTNSPTMRIDRPPGAN